MPTFSTIYRAIVMIAVGVIVVKGWQLYGPTNEQAKSFGVRALDMAQSAWNNTQQPATESSGPAADPRMVIQPAAPIVAPPLQTAPPLQAPLEPILPVTGLVPQPSDVPATTVPSPGITMEGTEVLPIEVTERLPLLYAKLEQLGGADPQLAPWGSSGELFRFRCRASLADTPAYARHFEAVAAEPVLAVEQVVAKVEAWRIDQVAVRR